MSPGAKTEKVELALRLIAIGEFPFELLTGQCADQAGVKASLGKLAL
jgi:hypothetical protein